MAPEYGPFRYRLEEYILSRTANHPALVPLVMFQLDQFCFWLVRKETLGGTSRSSWLDQAALDGLGQGPTEMSYCVASERSPSDESEASLRQGAAPWDKMQHPPASQVIERIGGVSLPHRRRA